MSGICEYHEKIEKRVSDVEDDIVELKMKTALDSQKFTLLLENLAKLPDAITDMKNSLVAMQNEIRKSGEKTESLEKKLDKLDAKVHGIDNEGYINLRIWFRDKFPYIAAWVVGGTGLGAWISTLF